MAMDCISGRTPKKWKTSSDRGYNTSTRQHAARSCGGSSAAYLQDHTALLLVEAGRLADDTYRDPILDQGKCEGKTRRSCAGLYAAMNMRARRAR